MKRNTLCATACSLILGASLHAATFVLPVAGSAAGANGSLWQSELTVHNVSNHAITLNLIFHDGPGSATAATVNAPALSTTSIEDIVSRFQKSGTGAIEINVADSDATKLAMTSRLTNRSAAGTYGQDIPVVASSTAAVTGDLVILNGPSSSSRSRFNFGVYAQTAATVTWQLVRSDGTVAATQQISYPSGIQLQYNSGVATFLRATPADNDVVQVSVSSGSVFLYGSVIDNASGDPTFVPGLRTQADLNINFAGIDTNHSGTVTIPADAQGALTKAVDVYPDSGFPTDFRIIASGYHGEPVTFQLLDSPADAMLIDANGLVSWSASSANRGKTLQIRVLVSTATTSSVIVIPVYVH